MPLNKVNYVDGQTVISAQNMNDIQDEVIRLGEKEPTQSDWLETDESSLAYIKNRPFGSAGQYRVICTAETMAISSDLIEINTKNDDFNNQMNNTFNNSSNVYYLYKISSGMFFDFFGIGMHQKIAFEYSDGQYLTIQDLKNGGGNIVSLSLYIDNPNVVSGKVYFYGDITYDLATSGIVLIEDSSDSILTPGLYVAFNAQKKSEITKVLINSSYLFNAPGALSMIDMPLAVNYAVMALDGIKQPLQPMVESVQESLNNFSSALDNKVDKETGKGLSEVNFTKAYETQVKNISSLESRISSLEYYHDDNVLNQEALQKSALLMTSSIAGNPRGSVINTQILMEEYEKLITGQSSDKLFILDTDTGTMAMKISDKLPSKEDFKKGFAVTVGGLDYMYGMDIMQPQVGIFVPSITLSPSFWEDEGEFFTDISSKSFMVMSAIVVMGDEDSDIILPPGLYAFGTMDQFAIGLQINGFDLNAPSAPVSQEQLGDINAILDSIIGQETAEPI